MVATENRPSPTVRLLISFNISYELAKDTGRAVTTCKLDIIKAYIASPTAEKAMPTEDLPTRAEVQAASRCPCLRQHGSVHVALCMLGDLQTGRQVRQEISEPPRSTVIGPLGQGGAVA